MDKKPNSLRLVLDFPILDHQQSPTLNSSQCSSPSQYNQGEDAPPRSPSPAAAEQMANRSHADGVAASVETTLDEEEVDLRLSHEDIPLRDVFGCRDGYSSSSKHDDGSDSIDPASLIAELSNSLDQFGNGPVNGGGRWAGTLVLECAKAVSDKATVRVQHLLWILNELASPYGDYEQRLAYCFLQALFCKISGSGPSYHSTLCAAVERNCSFDSLRKAILKFQEASPWTTFGHVAANGAILEAFDGEGRVHILDLSNTFCTQWPTLLEALATRSDGAPHLRLTTVIVSKDRSAMKAMKEVGARMEKFARLMGVPFEFNVQQELELERLQQGAFDLQPGEALAINCNQSLHHVPERESKKQPRDEILQTLRNMEPKVLTVVEEEVDLVSGDFLASLCEALRFYALYFESLEESFPRVSNERLMLERAAARSMVNLFACEEEQYMNCEKRENSRQWGERLARAGFTMAQFSDDAVDDVRALLKRYKEGWGLKTTTSGGGDKSLLLTWRDQGAVFASAWKPC